MKWIGWFGLAVCMLGCGDHYFREDADALWIYLKAPQAGQVELLASFNGFEPLPARRVLGAWAVSVPRGIAFTYFYRIDGQIGIPDCELRERDDFDRFNCIFQQAP